MSRITSWIALGLAAVLAALAGFWLARQLDSPDPQLTSGTWLPQPRELPEFQLVDHTGAPFTRESLRGHATLVFFGFTHCPDVCPATLAKLAQVKQAASMPQLRVLLVSVDPERDTPEALAAYVRAFDREFTGVTGDPQAVAQLTRSFGVATARTELPGGGYTVDHSAAVFLLDAQGRMVAVFTPPFEVARMAEDLQRAASRLGA
ncbi:MAG: SCO family protein [Pseudomonadota bacterium]|jgi:Uncharacterized protein SCO1/SenC/PrrC, involved in biogenesis of respiratory and photosynthetic systems|nr:MAG: SCO family protein [Pseudomonadota bacterium]